MPTFAVKKSARIKYLAAFLFLILMFVAGPVLIIILGWVRLSEAVSYYDYLIFAVLLLGTLLWLVAILWAKRQHRVAFCERVRLDGTALIFEGGKREFTLNLESCDMKIDPKGFRLFSRSRSNHFEYQFPERYFEERDYLELKNALSSYMALS